MNSLLIDFIVEARDLLESVSLNLLELERDPENAELLTLSFRAFHTLKGDSGLFDFRPITDVLHAAEDQLGALRDGTVGLTHELIDALLASGDQIGRWLIDIEKTESLPADAAGTAERLTQRLESLSGTGDPKTSSKASIPFGKADLSSFEEQARRRAAVLSMRNDDLVTYVRYVPEADCFFRGEDPLFAVQQIDPCLLSIDTPAVWAGLDELDPYQCVISFTAVTVMSREEVEFRFQYLLDQTTILDLHPSDLWVPTTNTQEVDALALSNEESARVGTFANREEVLSNNPNGSVRASELIAELVGSLEVAGDPSILEGRLLSTATVLRRIIPLDEGEEARLERAVDEGIAHEAADPLISWIRSLTEEPPPSAPIRPKSGAESRENQSSIKMIKVDQSRIDRIMSLIGEMVVAKNSLPYLSERAEHTYGIRELSREIRDQFAVINRITQEMQDAIMEVRMLPVSHVLQRFPRMVRDLSRKLGKKIEMITDGEDTEADKAMIEALGDPLLHIIRNSLDHGIETPEERVDAGKPETGLIRVKASQDNGQVLIVISDDGRGIDPKRIKAKALSTGVLDLAQSEAMSDREAIQLIFHAGLSTAETITDVSGRGVGMDVVRSAIEQVGGSVFVQSELGKGTSVQIALPMTMATSQVMVIKAGGQLFGVPMPIVLETLRVPTTSIFRFKDSEMIVRREQTVPLVRLNKLLGLRRDNIESEETSVLVVRHGVQSVGVVVEDFEDNVEVILKPVEGILGGLRGFSSSALLGDGKVLLILDLQELL
jgi:two-component system chemotaxis sensor kinase CheA